jgi:hypothetical protein
MCTCVQVYILGLCREYYCVLESTYYCCRQQFYYHDILSMTAPWENRTANYGMITVLMYFQVALYKR